jgi:BMFP domain-containing protein YqiC
MAKKNGRTVHPKLTKEVSELGKQVEKAIRSAAKSPELKDLSAEISRSLQRVGEKVVDALRTAKGSDQGRKVGEQFKKVVDIGKESGKETAEKVRQNLTKGLKGIGAELAKIADKLEKR